MLICFCCHLMPRLHLLDFKGKSLLMKRINYAGQNMDSIHMFDRSVCSRVKTSCAYVLLSCHCHACCHIK